MTRCQVLLFALCSLAAACGTTSDPAPTAPTAPQAAGPQALQQQCVATMTHSRACTDQYVPALVDARARLDQPSGIAAAVHSRRS